MSTLTQEEYLKELEDISNDTDLEAIIDFLAQNNEAKYNYTKAAEELNELATVLLQKANKSKDYQPKLQEFIDEFGDIIWRMEIAIGTMCMKDGVNPDEFHEAVQERIYKKTTGQLKNIKAGKYAKGR